MTTSPHDVLTPMRVEPVTLENEHVRLEPLHEKHASDLSIAVEDDTFRYFPMRSSVRTVPELRRYIAFQTSRDDTLAFAIIDPKTNRAIGSTSYMTIRPEHRSLEIGSTWITSSARGTRINPAMKRLLLAHAFETLGAVRVELKTDSRNARSRAAILKLGALEEGTLRNHIVMPDGVLRHSVYYSVTPEEWPRVKARLDERLTRSPSPRPR
jgi:RimJ/RimL family protein N-acetyltransferase